MAARMSVDLLGRCTGQTRRRRGETTEGLLQRVTHLYCSERGINRIECLSSCHSLSVLYLYNNSIHCVEGLTSCSNLTHLYLQNNHISRLVGLSTLNRLSKLYVSDNAISVVEGLEQCQQLTELHIANQRLPEGDKLHFDPRSLQAIASSLSVLNVSGTSLDSLQEIAPLKKLLALFATDNKLSSMKDLAGVLCQWRGIERVELSRNPLCSKHKYRDRVITMAARIRMLDGREVSDTERQFLANWKATRKARRRAMQQQSDQQASAVAGGQSSVHYVLSSDPPPPLTMPALPARSPIRQWRKINHQMRVEPEPFSLPALMQQQQPALTEHHLPMQHSLTTSHYHQVTHHNTMTSGRAPPNLPVLNNILQSIT